MTNLIPTRLVGSLLLEKTTSRPDSDKPSSHSHHRASSSPHRPQQRARPFLPHPAAGTPSTPVKSHLAYLIALAVLLIGLSFSQAALHRPVRATSPLLAPHFLANAMYYPQQSPGVAHKLPSHHDQNPWSRQHHPILVAQGQSGVPPPPSPGYALYANGMNPLQHHPGLGPLSGGGMQHHHQSSLSHYPSPPNGQNHHQTMSPASVGSQIISPHWQQQLLKCEMVRSSRSPHHRARASAMASRTVAKSAIPITNPNAVKLTSITTTTMTTTTDTPSSSTTTSSISTITTTAKDSSTDPSSAPENSPSTNHPSATVAPVAEAPRLMAIKPPENTWNSLDMGGVNIKNIPPTSGLFSFTFLINLYLNHNALSTVPPEISKLQHLELLDLSGNNLTTLPPELGMLTQLKELYVFDNHLTTIPPQFGSLHQLQTLGVEGNPLNTHMKEIIQKDGTPAFICYLRDSAPVPSPPPERIWKSLLSPAEESALASDPTAETFSVLCYNILCERYATERLYGYTPSWALAWDYRRELILAEVAGSGADFLCLQEVSIVHYEEYFSKRLGELGYEGVHWPKGRYKTLSDTDRKQVDGCAVFYKSNRFQLIENHLIEYSALAMQRQDFKKTDDMFNRVLGKDHIAVVCFFEDKHTGTRVIVANTHIHWDPNYSDVKLVQMALLMDELEKMGNAFAKYPPRLHVKRDGEDEDGKDSRPPPTYSDATKIPTIVSGDFNSVPDSGLCEFLSSGYLQPDHPDFMSHTYGRYTSEGLKHRLGLKNAYMSPGVGEMPVTNFTPGFKGVLDHVWYSAGTLGINGVLGGVDVKYLEKEVGFPNAHFPSDHICLIAEFRVKPLREAPPRPPPPVFHNS